MSCKGCIHWIQEDEHEGLCKKYVSDSGGGVITMSEDSCDRYVPKGEASPVNHPDHYAAGGLECIDVIRAVLGDEGFSAFCLGNVIKYLWRHNKKNGIEDLQKASVYIDWLIQSDVKVATKEKA